MLLVKCTIINSAILSGCPEGYYGEHCVHTCLCEKGQVCDPVIGCNILGSHQGK